MSYLPKTNKLAVSMKNFWFKTSVIAMSARKGKIFDFVTFRKENLA